jgi:hypothetical protein
MNKCRCDERLQKTCVRKDSNVTTAAVCVYNRTTKGAYPLFRISASLYVIKSKKSKKFGTLKCRKAVKLNFQAGSRPVPGKREKKSLKLP